MSDNGQRRPRADAPGSFFVLERRRSPVPPSPRPRLVVAEDQALIRLDLERLLVEAGFDEQPLQVEPDQCLIFSNHKPGTGRGWHGTPSSFEHEKRPRGVCPRSSLTVVRHLRRPAADSTYSSGAPLG